MVRDDHSPHAGMTTHWEYWGQHGYRDRARRLLDNPKSSNAAWYFSAGMLVLILVNTVLLCLETQPANVDGWMIEADLVFNAIFTLELFARCAVGESARAVAGDVYIWFDTISVLPAWIVIVSGSDHSAMRIMRAMRTLRLLKLSRQYDGSIVIYRALRLSLAALGVPFYFLAVAVIVFASFLYYLELEGDEESQFDSIPHAIWCVASCVLLLYAISPCSL